MPATPQPHAAANASTQCKGSSALTRGWQVDVIPTFIPEHSDPDRRKWVFVYRITVHNRSKQARKLVERHWIIVNAHGSTDEVRGEGVVGEQPLIEPGQAFRYQSFCPLSTSWGTMEGAFVLESDEGDRMEARVGRFYLVGSARE